ncbi:MAG: transposase [Clostridia bacterium]|nr:transposase [Clostridia bacterium]
MKNHIRVDGRLLQTNKKWSHLKEKQKTWIMETARREYDRFVHERGKLPVHGSKQQLNEHVYELIEEKGIWVPYGEIKRVLDARIAHWNRQAEQAAASAETGEKGKVDAQPTE